MYLNSKPLISSIFLLGSVCGYAQMDTLNDVAIINDSYGRRISHDGSQIIADSMEGSTIYYNRLTNEIYYYDGCDFGKGYNVSDNGWVVGCRLIDDEATRAVVMEKGNYWYPEVFSPSVSSNIHSITPDGSRVCGVIGNAGAGPTYFPFYCDIDADGNFGKVNILPTPPKDFFNASPQYCSATWISSDGNTIAGQVIDSRGFFVYPILYKYSEEDGWTYSFPSESLFNPDGLNIPEPLPDMAEMFPDSPYPEITDFMSDENKLFFEEALKIWMESGMDPDFDPYDNLDVFMTDEEIIAYVNAVNKYNAALEEYSYLNDEYWLKLFEIADSSVFFVRNALALSNDAEWLACSAQVDDLSDPFEPIGYYIPYLFNLVTGETIKIGPDRTNLIPNQVFANGTVIASSPANEILPQRTFVYQNSVEGFIDFEKFVESLNPEYSEWMRDNLTAEVPVAINPDGGYLYETVLVSGIAGISDDYSVISAGVDGYALDLDKYFTYIFEDVSASVKGIGEEAVKKEGRIDVYNLQGVKVMTTTEASKVRSLPKGLYIINGHKIII